MSLSLVHGESSAKTWRFAGLEFGWIGSCYSTQIEDCSLLALRFGFTVFFVALASWGDARRELRRPWWYPFPLKLVIWNHSAQCAMHYLFKIKVGGFGVWWKTKGESRPGHHRWDEVGLCLQYRTPGRRYHHVQLWKWPFYRP